MRRLSHAIAGAVAALGSFFVLGATAFAQSVTLTNPLGSTTFPQVVTNVTNFLATDIAIPLTVIMVLVGAFQMMTSSGDPEKFGKARKTLTYAAIGLAVALIATGVTTLIQNILNGQ